MQLRSCGSSCQTLGCVDAILNKMTFEQKLEGGEEASLAYIWETIF